METEFISSGYGQVQGLLFIILGQLLQSEDGLVEQYVAYIGVFKWVKTCIGEQLELMCKTKFVWCTTLKYLPKCVYKDESTDSIPDSVTY
jgi:hypothetical protein